MLTLPAGIVSFAVTSIGYTRWARRRCKRKRYDTTNTNHAHPPRYLPLPDGDEDNVSIIDDAVADVLSRSTATAAAMTSLSSLPSLSRRGQRAALPPTPAHWGAFLRCLQDPCDALHNPEGFVALCLAENRLVQEMLAHRLMRSDTAVGAFRHFDV